MIAFTGIALGLIFMIVGGTLLVRGASAVAASYGVSPMVVGLTIVGFGTSAPELAVNLLGAFHGATDLAFGNVIGSNISNLGLVLGLAAVIAPIAIRGDLVRRELPLLLLATSMMTVMALDPLLEGASSRIGLTDSIVLLLMFLMFLYVTATEFVRNRGADPLVSDINERPIMTTSGQGRMQWLQIVAGCTALFIGGEFTIRNGIELASQLGIPATIVGLFVVAVGTSMPELVTSIIAAVRREPDLALGNVIGSNIFNSLMVLPLSGLVTQIPVPRGGITDLIVSLALAAVLIPVFFLGRARLGRGTGLLFLAAYALYATVRVMESTR